LGFVDTVDIMTDMTEHGSFSPDLTEEQIQNRAKEGSKEFINHKCKDLINRSGRDPLKILFMNRPVIHAIQELTDSHRVLIEDQVSYHVLAQIDIISFLMRNHSVMETSLLHRKIVEAGLLPRAIVGTMREELPTMNAMRYMRDCGVSGIGVVNKEGKLVTNLSATDFLGLHPDAFSLLALPIKDFLKKMRGISMLPICSKVQDSMESILYKMEHNAIHRIYFVNDDMEPIGFLSTTDIMQYLSTVQGVTVMK